MIARTESRAARRTSVAETSCPVACAFCATFSVTRVSISPQSPSSAETSSPFIGTGQSERAHRGPFAWTSTAWLSSFMSAKKACQSASTDVGSTWYLA